MLLLLMIIDEECQTVTHPKRGQYHTISHTTHIDHYNTSSQQSTEDRTLGKHQWLQQLVYDIFAPCGRMISPLLEKLFQQGLSWQEQPEFS